MLFTRLGVWGFNPKYLCGVYVYNLPLEELLFFLCIPYASLFTYHCLSRYFSTIQFQFKTVSLILCGGLLITTFFPSAGIYTRVTFPALILFLIYISFFTRAEWLKQFYLCYLVILVPFFLVNGLLTGSWIEEPVVWYNADGILGLRLLTIPVEDVFYGMLMLVLNTWLYEKFRNANAS